jgi:hypothetical protein
MIKKNRQTMSAHAHNFSENEWPFQDAVNTAAFTTTRVLRDNYPILLVTHDDNGDWQILCGTTNDEKDCLVVCLGCAFEKDRSIGELADLPLGWNAWRKSPFLPWQRAPDTQIQSRPKTAGLHSLFNRILGLLRPRNK